MKVEFSGITTNEIQNATPTTVISLFLLVLIILEKFMLIPFS
jgi:hypothetical protein